MIITKTPYRISFFGGGSDYPAWYKKNGGAVLSTTIDKYIYITCRFSPDYFKQKYRIVWRKIENVKKINEIKSQMGSPEMARSDGLVQTLRYDSKSCRLFLFFNLNSSTKRVEHFEFRDYLGELLNTKQSLESCYREYKLIS